MVTHLCGNTKTRWELIVMLWRIYGEGKRGHGLQDAKKFDIANVVIAKDAPQTS